MTALPILQPGPPIAYDGRLCGECAWCCRAFAVEVPARPVSTSLSALDIYHTKAAGVMCWWQTQGCQLHGGPYFPSRCRDYVCPYVLLEGGAGAAHLNKVKLASGAVYPGRVHRPDVFAAVLSEPWVEARGVMPLVPAWFGAEHAIELTRETRTIPAARPDKLPDGTSIGFRATLQKLTAAADGAAGRARWDAAIGYGRCDDWSFWTPRKWLLRR